MRFTAGELTRQLLAAAFHSRPGQALRDPVAERHLDEIAREAADHPGAPQVLAHLATLAAGLLGVHIRDHGEEPEAHLARSLTDMALRRHT